MHASRLNATSLGILVLVLVEFLWNLTRVREIALGLTRSYEIVNKWPRVSFESYMCLNSLDGGFGFENWGERINFSENMLSILKG